MFKHFFSSAAVRDQTEQFANSMEALCYQAVQQQMPLIEFSPQGEILQANALFLQAVGYSSVELAGAHHRIFCPPAYASSREYQQFWQQLAMGEPQAWHLFTSTEKWHCTVAGSDLCAGQTARSGGEDHQVRHRRHR